MTHKIYPFKFLNAYQKEDKHLFFGREEEIKALYEMVFQTDLILVYGASGTGKSSLLQCGLAGRFESHDWLPIPIRRGSNLNDSFERELEKVGGGKSSENTEELDWLGQDWEAETAMESAEKLLSPLAKCFKTIYLKHFKPVYLIFDQFEELYILGNKDEQTQFIETVKEILKVEQPVKILISIREEYLGELYEFEKAVPELLRKKLRVEPMNLDKVRTVMNGINAVKNGNVSLKKGEENALTEAIFDKIKGKEKTLTIQLPYLQVFLDKFYMQLTADEDRQKEAVFSLHELQKMGDIGDILRNFLDDQVSKIAKTLAQNPNNLWKMLSPFVTLEGTKEPISQAQLENRLPSIATETLQKALQAFVSSRILRFNESEQVYEITHDSLAKQIHAKRSDEEIAIMEVQRLIKSQVLLKENVRDYFSEKQLLFIEPFLDKFRLEKEEQDWIDKSKTHLANQKAQEEARQANELAKAKADAEKEASLRQAAEAQQKIAKTRSWIAVAVAIVALIAMVVAFYQYQNAERQTKTAKAAQKSDSIARVKADASALVAKAAQKSDSIAKVKANTSALVAKVEREKADSAAKVAENNAAEAERQKREAEAQRKEADNQKVVAQNNAAEAEKQRKEAERKKKEAEEALEAKGKEEVARKQAEKKNMDKNIDIIYALLRTKEKQEAKELWQKCLQIEPNNPKLIQLQKDMQ